MSGFTIVRGQEGQIRSAALLRRLLADSEIRESHRVGDPRVQDAYALALHAAGARTGGRPARASPATSSRREINAATDNPLVFEDGALLSGGNFHGQAVAMVLDMLAIGMTNLAVIAERRIDRLVHPDLNQGLPPFLTQDAGVSSGYMIAQVTAAALASECKVLSHPASVDSIPTDGNKEDVVPMAMGAAWKLRRDRGERAKRPGHRAAVCCAGASISARRCGRVRRWSALTRSFASWYRRWTAIERCRLISFRLPSAIGEGKFADDSAALGDWVARPRLTSAICTPIVMRQRWR